MILSMSVPASGQMPVTVFADDGTPLATDVYLPLALGTHPVVLIRTPYGRDGFQQTCIALALLRYACVAQDTRGRGDSGGIDTVFRDDADDGRATIRWLTEREWCDGNIGMFGGEKPSRIELPVLPVTGNASGRVQPVGEGVRFAPASWP